MTNKKQTIMGYEEFRGFNEDQQEAYIKQIHLSGSRADVDTLYKYKSKIADAMGQADYALKVDGLEDKITNNATGMTKFLATYAPTIGTVAAVGGLAVLAYATVIGIPTPSMVRHGAHFSMIDYLSTAVPALATMVSGAVLSHISYAYNDAAAKFNPAARESAFSLFNKINPFLGASDEEKAAVLNTALEQTKGSPLQADVVREAKQLDMFADRGVQAKMDIKAVQHGSLSI
jgi:hypothetical protein